MQEKINIKHNEGIDVLRGLAILSVIFLHIQIRVPFSSTLFGSVIPDPIYKILFFSGFYGVCVFFVISGFLITTSTLNKWGSLNNTSLQGFYSMRFARIMPLLIALLIILSILHLANINGFVINPSRTTLGRAIFAALTFHINLLEIKTGYLPGSWDVLWSLSIEEVFYLFFPIFCIICRKEWIFVVLISVFLFLSPFARTVWYPGNDLADINHFAYLDAISLGCIAALISKKIEINKASLLKIGVTGWVLFIFVLFFRKWVSVIGLTKIGLNITLLAIGTSFILIWMQKHFVNGQSNLSKYTGVLRFMGRNSYEIYLTHMFVVFLLVWVFKILKLTGEWAWLLYFLIVGISVILGAMVSRYFSNPVNSMLRLKFKTIIKQKPVV